MAGLAYRVHRAAAIHTAERKTAHNIRCETYSHIQVEEIVDMSYGAHNMK